MPKYVFGSDIEHLQVVAVVLGWGTIGVGLLIAYKSPTVGLGCDSGGYLVYGACATSSWIVLVALLSAYLSHLHCSRAEIYPSMQQFIFAGDAEIASAAHMPWIVGVVMGISVGLATLAWICGGRGDDTFKGNKH